MSNSYLLVINAAEGLVQYLVAESSGSQGTILAAHSWRAFSQGVELLAPALENCFSLLKISFHDLERVACVIGPGSFTGLRLAQMTCAGLARATGAKQGGVYYLPLLAQTAKRQWSAFKGARDAVFWVITHARQGLVHAQRFAGNDQSAVGDVLVLDLPALCTMLAAEKQDCFCLGSGVMRNQEVLSTTLGEAAPVFLPEIFNHPSFEDLLEAALAASYSPADISPFYVRPCDAEDNLEHIASLLQLDPKQAKELLLKLTTTLG